jgi:outer membrane protein OmpA-like peptidoglycan-associated protein
MTIKKYYSTVTLCVSAFLLASCSQGRYPAIVEQAQSDVLAAQRDSVLMSHAPLVVADSAQSLRMAEEVWSTSRNDQEVEHLVYLTQRRLGIAQQKSREQISQSLTLEQLQRNHLAAERLEYDSQSRNARLDMLERESAHNQADLRELQFDANQQMAGRTAVDQSGARRQFTFDSDALFKSDSAELRPGAFSRLRPLMGRLEKDPSRSISIEGHTDNVGGARSNQVLSLDRAEAIAALLVDNGIEASRISCKGVGEERPEMSNRFESGRNRNRRMRIVLGDL